jgi:hypothetical protein
MDEKRLAEIRERCEAATDGPWLSNAPEGYVFRSDEQTPICETLNGNFTTPTITGAFDDAIFIAHARQDIPDLLECIDRLTLRQEQDAATIWRLMDVLPGREEKTPEQWSAWREALASEAVQETQAVYAERDGLLEEVERLQVFAIAMYREGACTIGKLSEVLGISLEDARERFGAPIGLDELPGKSGELPPAVNIIAQCVPITGSYNSDGSEVERIEMRPGDELVLYFSGEMLNTRLKRNEGLPPGYVLSRGHLHKPKWWWAKIGSECGPNMESAAEAIAAAWKHYRANGGVL